MNGNTATVVDTQQLLGDVSPGYDLVNNDDFHLKLPQFQQNLVGQTYQVVADTGMKIKKATFQTLVLTISNRECK